MAEIIACLKRGKVQLLLQGQPAAPLLSPYQEGRNARGGGDLARIVAITRGRINGELCYATCAPEGSSVFAQVPGSGAEERLFFSDEASIREIDFGLASEALTGTVAGERGTSFIGVLADDGRGMRTVTEGDVVDRCPRWAPGGRAEIVYASAGIGRTRRGLQVGRSPFALHRLRFADSSVEVLVADARYDYLAPVQTAEHEFVALRSPYRAPPPPSPLRLVLARFPRLLQAASRPELVNDGPRELVRISRAGSQSLAEGVFAFDVSDTGQIVYSTAQGVFRLGPSSSVLEIAALTGAEQLCIC